MFIASNLTLVVENQRKGKTVIITIFEVKKIYLMFSGLGMVDFHFMIMVSGIMAHKCVCTFWVFGGL